MSEQGSEVYNQGRQGNDTTDETASLMLSRTRSQEITIAETIVTAELPPKDPPSGSLNSEPEPSPTEWPRSVRYLVFTTAFLMAISFGTTQVPLVYAFRLMVCDDYYKDHPAESMDLSEQPTWIKAVELLLLPYLTATNPSMDTQANDGSDRCSLRPIEASTALWIAVLGASTTVFGIINLFLTGYLIKKIGVKRTLVLQMFFPAVRLFIQNIGINVWGYTGIHIIQISQTVSIIGGPSGYLLALNTYITEIVGYAERTAALGRVQGFALLGSAIGFLLGGVLAGNFGIASPFRVTFLLFLISGTFATVTLPYIAPAKAQVSSTASTARKKKRQSVVGQIFGPMAVFVPRKFIRADGVVQLEYGTFLLAWGVYLGILATGYLPTLLQLYSTDVFGFETQRNGLLIFIYSTLRGVFLTFAFPAIIAFGRGVTEKATRTASEAGKDQSDQPSERQPLLPSESRPAPTKTKSKKEPTFTFDLIYTRFSLLADGVTTLLCSFVWEGWQMYLVACILPFAAGTGSAAKGTILQMIGSSAGSDARTDALAGVGLVENMARLSTTFVFGAIFAMFANIGRTELIFVVNASVALLAFLIMLFARFPPEGSRPLDDAEDEDEDEE